MQTETTNPTTTKNQAARLPHLLALLPEGQHPPKDPTRPRPRVRLLEDCELALDKIARVCRVHTTEPAEALKLRVLDVVHSLDLSTRTFPTDAVCARCGCDQVQTLGWCYLNWSDTSEDDYSGDVHCPQCDDGDVETCARSEFKAETAEAVCPDCGGALTADDEGECPACEEDAEADALDDLPEEPDSDEEAL